MPNHGRMLLIIFSQLSLAVSCQQPWNGIVHSYSADSFLTSLSSILLITSADQWELIFLCRNWTVYAPNSDDTNINAGGNPQELAKDGQDPITTSITKETTNKYKISHFYAVRKVTRLSTFVLDRDRLLPFPNLYCAFSSSSKRKKNCQLVCHGVSMKQNLITSFCYKYHREKLQKGKKYKSSRQVSLPN